MVHGQPGGFRATAAVFNHPAAIPIPTEDHRPGSTPSPGAVQRTPGLVLLPPFRTAPIMGEPATTAAAADQLKTTLSTIEAHTARRHTMPIGWPDPTFTAYESPQKRIEWRDRQAEMCSVCQMVGAKARSIQGLAPSRSKIARASSSDVSLPLSSAAAPVCHSLATAITPCLP
jgi:hypothetical protein